MEPLKYNDDMFLRIYENKWGEVCAHTYQLGTPNFF